MTARARSLLLALAVAGCSATPIIIKREQVPVVGISAVGAPVLVRMTDESGAAIPPEGDYLPPAGFVGEPPIFPWHHHPDTPFGFYTNQICDRVEGARVGARVSVRVPYKSNGPVTSATCYRSVNVDNELTGMPTRSYGFGATQCWSGWCQPHTRAADGKVLWPDVISNVTVYDGGRRVRCDSNCGYHYPPPIPLLSCSSIKLTFNGEATAELAWAPAEGASRYQVEVARNGSFRPIDIAFDQVVVTTQVKITGLEGGTDYFARVRAFDVAGNVSRPCRPLTWTSPPPAGQACTDFLLGACCAGSSWVNCIRTACRTDADCVRRPEPYRTCSLAGDMGAVTAAPTVTYPPERFGTFWPANGVAFSMLGKGYGAAQILLPFVTAELPDESDPQTASLELGVGMMQSADDCEVVLDWYQASPPPSGDDYMAAPLDNAHVGTKVADMLPVDGLDRVFELNAFPIDPTLHRHDLRASIRCPGPPTGTNLVAFDGLGNGTVPALRICYE